jgi:hypothetical protein
MHVIDISWVGEHYRLGGEFCLLICCPSLLLLVACCLVEDSVLLLFFVIQILSCYFQAFLIASLDFMQLFKLLVNL